METPPLSKCTTAFGISLAIASVTSALLVVVKELSPNIVMPLMKRVTGQHWVTHSVFAVALFLILGWALTLANGGAGLRMGAGKLIAILTCAVVVGSAIIAGFYLFVG